MSDRKTGNAGVPMAPGVATKCLQLLGLALRARQVVVGNEGVMAAVRDGKAKLVLLASDAGANAEKKYRDKCAFYHIPIVGCFTKTQLGHACGRHQTVIVAFTDPGFAAKMKQYLGESSGGEAFGETSGV